MNIILFDELSAENFLPFSDYRGEHIQKILHLKEGDQFLAGVTNKQKGLATITSIDETGVHFRFVAQHDNSSHLYPVTLLLAQVRPICMKRILREAVSLGVERILLTGCDTTEKSYANANLYKSGEYKSILLDGAMQSGETGVSEVLFARSVDHAMHLLLANTKRILLDNVLESKPLSSMEIGSDVPVVLAIGPERGFSDRERDVMMSSGFVPATLGARILRTETACSAGLGVLLGRMGLL
ncbi:RNA methyltransferase, RsmE family [Sphaerochaeta pleomorpha str. Grapes]|uniref:Ribosomal RNA small subunit methyltransferase E n=2 Tax=Sphaerochaeta TaxID=399320 RepID=G8QT88_SPHPG|nr:RNA methyltransferase, RsmE family [Sphaerochaeta pleomorpha str. Grapes]